MDSGCDQKQVVSGTVVIDWAGVGEVRMTEKSGSGCMENGSVDIC